MKRDMKKAIEQHEKRFANTGTPDGSFYLSDVEQIQNMSANDYEAIVNALRAGFTIGYRRAQREFKRNAGV